MNKIYSLQSKVDVLDSNLTLILSKLEDISTRLQTESSNVADEDHIIDRFINIERKLSEIEKRLDKLEQLPVKDDEYSEFSDSSEPYIPEQDVMYSDHEDNSSKRVFGKWSQEEDRKLISLIQNMFRKIGSKHLKTGHWRVIANQMQTRTDQQCRLRWEQTLDPSINKAPFTLEEDELLLRKYTELGSKWSEMSIYFKNRTPCQLRLRFAKLQRK